jgi:hypothetical protein
VRRTLRLLWKTLCALAAAAIGAALLGFGLNSWILAVVGAVVGLPIGWLFGRFISPLEMLTGLD